MNRAENKPKLRFPEFQKEWEIKCIEEVSTKVNSGKTPLGGEKVYVKEGVFFIRSQNVNNNELFLENVVFIPEDLNATMYNSIVKANDILLNITGASIGRSCVVPLEFSIGNVNQHVCIIRLDKKNNPRFLQPILASEKGQNILFSLQAGGGREGLNFQNIRSFQCFFPSLPEQTKIASFFTAIDQKLTLLKKKKSLLEQYKKGVMQRIFCLNCDSYDYDDDNDFENHNSESRQSYKSKKSQFRQLRFKDENGNEFPEWGNKKLGEITFKFSRVNKDKHNYPVFSISNKYGFIPQNQQFEDLDSEKRGYDISLYKIVEKNVFAYNPARINVGSIGYSGSINNVIISSLYVCFKTVNEINDYFLLYFFNTNHFKRSVLKKTEGGVRDYLFYDNFSSIKISTPHYSEQTKIANFLTVIDDKINLCQQQIEKTELWKKGLMQKMFC